MRKDQLGLSCSSHSVPPDSPPLCEIVVCSIHECTGSASGTQEKGPEAKKKKKSRDLAKVVVLLKRGLIFSSKIDEKVRNA